MILIATLWHTFGIRSTFHTTLQASPGQIVFGRDMINDVRFQASWDRIKNNKQNNISSSNKRENLNRIKHNVKVGDRILLRKNSSTTKVIGTQVGNTILEVGKNWMIKIQ
jgi:hypothetical protein